MNLYVTNAGEDSISVVDPDSMKEAGRIYLRGEKPKGPRRLLYSKGTLCCANAYSNSLCFLQEGRNVEFLVGASPTALCFCGERLLVCCSESDSVWVFGEREQIVSIHAFPCSLEPYEGGFVSANMQSGNVSVFSEELKKKYDIAVDGMPMYALPDGEGRFFCSHTVEYAEHGFLSIFAEGRLIKRLAVGSMPTTLAVLPNKKMLVANTGNSTLCLVDMQALECVRWIHVGYMPDDIVFWEEKNRVFVSSMMEDSVYVLDGEGDVLGKIPVGKEPRGLVLGGSIMA
ncbi:MAG: YncE family protein [Christensenellales bacterium]